MNSIAPSASLNPAIAGPASSLGRRLATCALLLFALGMGLYGLLAIETAHVNFTAYNDPAVLEQRLQSHAAANSGQDEGIEARSWRSSGVWIAGFSKLTSPQYAYGEDGFFSSVIHYARMPKDVIATLSLHNLMGGICMLFGALQFWPALRRRYPRWHRGFGLVYMVTAQIGMIAAMRFMLRTPLEKMYDQLTFTVGLWVLAIGVTLTLWMSIFHLLRREYAQHQAYMALNYGFLLTAPFTRIDWTWSAWLFPGVTQMVGNYVTAVVLIPSCVLMGYGLLSLNRWMQQDRPAPNPRPGMSPAVLRRVTLSFTAITMLLTLAGAATVLWFYVIDPGLANYSVAQSAVPASALAHDTAVFAGRTLSRLLYAAATIGALLLALPFLRAAFLGDAQPRQTARWATGLALFAIVSGAVQLYWGGLLGGPSHAVLAGGVPFVFDGVTALVFALLLGHALRRGHAALVKELGLYTLLGVLSLPTFYWMLPLFNAFPVPPEMVQTGHVYRLAIYFGLFLMIGAMVYSAYGSATQQKFAR